MASKNTFITTIEGAAELGDLFEQLPKQLTDNVLRTTGKKALEPVRDMAKSLVTVGKEDGGQTRDSITIKTVLSKRQRRIFKKKGDIAVYMGPSAPEGAAGVLLEFGTGERRQRSTGRRTGSMGARPFMRPAWDATKGQVLDVFRTEIWDVLVKAVRRLRVKAEKGTLGRGQRRFFGGF